MKKNDYVLLGFDLKISNYDLASIDVFIWEQDENNIELLLSSGGMENIFQLLSGDLHLVEEITSKGTIAVAVMCNIKYLPILEGKFGKYNYSNISWKTLLDQEWLFRGFDIVDIDGMFSFFGMFTEFECSKLLTLDDDLEAYVKLANTMVPEHVPFLPLAIFTYQKK